MAEVLAAERGLAENSAESEFIDGAWKLFAGVTNTAHHERSRGNYAAPDARAALLFTAVLLEYLADSLTRQL